MIPFIKAESDRDAAFVLGMVHAHLRLGQMYMMKEVVNHRLASHAGPIATGIDHSLMAMDLFSAVDDIETSLDSDTRDWLQAFVDGLNHYQSSMKDLPLELRMLSLKPEPWTLRDILSFGRLVSADVNWFYWFSHLKLLDDPLWQEYWQELLTKGNGTTLSSPLSDGSTTDLIKNYARWGSNAFVVSAAKSETGHAIMATDPHLGLMLPNIWLIAGYQSPSYHVLGLMFPGLPVVLVGRNKDIAFSGTNMRSASSDLYAIDAQDPSITSRTARIKVRGWFDKKVILRRSAIGPIISDAKSFKSGTRTLAMRWVGHEPSDELGAALKMNKAKDWNSFQSAFQSYAVSGQNYLYADTKDNIGLLPAVKIPRRSYDKPPSLVLQSDVPKLQWNGYLDSNSLPYTFNPPSAFIASANNQPMPTATPLGFFSRLQTA